MGAKGARMDPNGPNGTCQGHPKIKENWKKSKKRKRKGENEEKLCFSIAGRFSLKIGRLNGSTFTEELLTIVLKKLRKKCHAEKQGNRKNEPISIQKTTFFKTLGPNGTVITVV